MNAKQLDLSGKEVGEKYAVSVKSVQKHATNDGVADRVESQDSETRHYTVRAPSMEDAISRALDLRGDLDSGCVVTVKVEAKE